MIASAEELERVGQACRLMVRRRARAAGALAAVPIPGIDVAGDVALLLEVIPAINRRFGLEPEQLDRLDSAAKVAFYRLARKVGGQFVGEAVTVELIVKIITSAGMAIAAETVLKYIPVVGSIASSVIAYEVFRRIAYSHIASCETIVREMLKKGIDDGSTPTSPPEAPATDSP